MDSRIGVSTSLTITNTGVAVSPEYFVLEVIMHNGEIYSFAFDWASRGEVLRTLGRFASNPELSLTWDDACYIARRLREVAVW